MYRLNAIGPQPLLKVHWIHIHNILEAYGDRGFFLFFLFFRIFITIHAQQRASTHHFIATVLMEIFQRASCLRTILNLIKDKTSLAWLNLRIGHSRRNAHDDGVHFQIRREEFLVVRMLTEIQIYHMLEMLFGKVHHTAGLAALADSFHNQWLV